MSPKKEWKSLWRYSYPKKHIHERSSAATPAFQVGCLLRQTLVVELLCWRAHFKSKSFSKAVLSNHRYQVKQCLPKRRGLEIQQHTCKGKYLWQNSWLPKHPYFSVKLEYIKLYIKSYQIMMRCKEKSLWLKRLTMCCLKLSFLHPRSFSLHQNMFILNSKSCHLK